MSKELLLLVDVLAKEKNLDKEIVFQSLEKALSIATKRTFTDVYPEINVVIDRATGKHKTSRVWAVIADDTEEFDADKELPYAVAQNKYSDIKIGDTAEEELESIALGRMCAQTARNIITQNIRDAERRQVLNDYVSRNYGIIVGKVKKIERGNVIVDCKRIEAIIPKSELIPKEVLQVGDQVKGYLDKDNITTRGGRLIISRASSGFLLKLLENNVPEIASGRIEVKSIAREPGVRAKVAVLSHDGRIDPIGACIGFRNQRIDSISSEIFGEQIDIIEYDANLAQYTLNALAPAQIDSIVVDEERKIVEVIVDDDKLGFAIGVDGVNVRLASALLGAIVNLRGKTESKHAHEHENQTLINMFSKALDVEEDIADILVKHGFSSLDEVAYVDLKELTQIEDFDDDIALELQSRAKDCILSKNILHKDAMDKLASQLGSIVRFARDVLLKLVEHNIYSLSDFADLSAEELMEMISIDLESANTLIMKARVEVGYFD